MEKQKTNKNFSFVEFRDGDGDVIRLQVGYSHTHPYVTLGSASSHNVIFLTKQHVKELLPHLQRFAETGDF